MKAGSDPAGVVAGAQALADELLFPRALQTDAEEVLPLDLLDSLAAAGLYGLVGPSWAGGSAVAPSVGDAVVEALASGCLTTTFVWAQHHNAVTALARHRPSPLAEEWLPDLCSGRRRAGIAFAGLRRPGPPLLTATPTDGGWRLDGSAPWVTGWERVDVVHVAARDAAGDVVWLLVDAVASPTMTVDWLRLAAVGASATVTLHFDGHPVDGARGTFTEAFEDFTSRDALGLRRNGSLALGVARRCTTLLEQPDDLQQAIDDCRAALDAANAGEMPVARAGAAELALHAATRLVVTGGGRSVLVSEHAQRLAREALFLQVFGQTGPIRAAQLERLGEGVRDMQHSPD